EAKRTTEDLSITEQTRFEKLLEETRKDAEANRKFDSASARQMMTEECLRHTGNTPYSWQLDISEAILLGLDSVLMAGTGAGKTLPFVLPLLVDKTGYSKIIIVSTLNELEQDQAARFNKMGIRSAAVNGETYSNQLHTDLKNHKIRVIITFPEMIFEHERFSKLIRNPAWMRRTHCTVIDEAHCVVHWGANFCKHFDKLGTMRSFMTISRPILIASATLTPALLEETLDKLEFNCNHMYKINRRNNRPNITLIVCPLPKGAKELESLEFLISEAQENQELKRTIVYVNSRDLAKVVCEHLQSKLPTEYHHQIDFIHSLQHPLAKKCTMRLFREGAIKILIATEVAGMGMDISDIRRVIQFKVMSTLSKWMQHFGRAGRDGEPAEAILFVEPSVYQMTKKRNSLDAALSPEMEPRKNLEQGMRQMATTDGCRRDVYNVIFENPRSGRRTLQALL
ncbi:P-loop containing nucleoside triphosphate hydrolase protein, partial [Cytidiella melzeri]